MSLKTKLSVFLAAIVTLITTISCATFTNALDFSGPTEEAAQPSIVGADEIEDTHNCNDCDYLDDFEFDENDRPILSGTELIQDTEHFRVHYTLSGRDAALSTAYVDEMAQALEYSWDVEIDQFGWAPPPPDDGIGGDDRYDIYIQNVFEDGTAGYTEGGDDRYRGAEQRVVGDNPLTEAVEKRAATSYIVIDNDYAELDDWAEADGEANTLDPLDFMRSTVAHEFNHAIQFGYDGEEPADWLWEATASWMQDEVYDDINDADEDLLAVFKSPDTCQLAYGGEQRVEDDNHWYGEWIFLRYISEHYGHETVRAIWEYARDLDGYAALEAALTDAETTLDDSFRGFSLSLLTRAFDEGAGYPILRLEGEAQNESNFAPNDGVGQMAADYVEIKSDGPVTVKLNAGDLEGMLIGVKNNQASIFAMNGNQTSVDAGQFGHIYLIILNLEQADNESDCESASYTVAVTSGGQPQVASQSISVPNFQAPAVEALLDPKEYWGEDWNDGEYDKVDAPAELIPGYMPEGYEFVEAYAMAAADYEKEFGVDLTWYIPGGGTATVIDFSDLGEDNYITITASESPYDTLEAWLEVADYTPYDDELVAIHGVDTLIEDWTDEYGPYSIATFIQDGQFIVIEGTFSTDEMTQVVESLSVFP